MCLKDAQDLLSAKRAGAEQPLPPPAADHHLHIQGPLATAEMRRLAERRPDFLAGLNPAILDFRSGADAIAQLDDAGIAQGVLLSEAYLLASPMVPDRADDPAGRVRSENAFNVDAALSSQGRLKAFIGVNPFAPGALEEITYWTGRDGVTGVKFHLGNSGFDPKSDGQMALLSRAFAAAGAAALPIIVHAKGPGLQSPEDTRRFVTDIVGAAFGSEIQIAHAGGGGGIDQAVLADFEVYAKAIDLGLRGTERLSFDLAAVLVRDPADQESVSLLSRFADIARRIGLERILAGSDWPTLCSPRDHAALLMAQIPFTPAEWTQILGNRAVYLD